MFSLTIALKAWVKAGRPTGFALLIAPTRELAKQLSDEAVRLGRCDSVSEDVNQNSNVRVVRLIGGEDMVEQALQLAWHRHHIIVGQLIYYQFDLKSSVDRISS